MVRVLSFQFPKQSPHHIFLRSLRAFEPVRVISVGAAFDRVNQSESSDIPLLEKEGWLQHKSNIAKLPNCAD
jgi:hypothetical protein